MSQTHEEAAKALADALRPYAAKLGMRLSVAYDKETFGYAIDAALIPQRVRHEITESVLDCIREHARARLLYDVLEDMQLQLHDAARAAMDKLDIRGRIVNLSDEDKETLHDMYRDACHDIAKYKPSYHLLMQKLFK